MANKPLWMPLCPADYLKDTRHLSTLEHGAYLLLLMAAWNDSGKLPADPARLARIAVLDAAQWSEVGPVVMAFFRRKGAHYEHGRVRRELVKADRLIEQKREAGKASAKARAAKEKSNGCSTSVAISLQRNANQSQSQGSDTNVSAASAARKELFSEGLDYLVGCGSSIGSARSFLGSLRKDLGDTQALALVRQAIRDQITDPKPWLLTAQRNANDGAAAMVASVNRTYGKEAAR